MPNIVLFAISKINGISETKFQQNDRCVYLRQKITRL